MRRSALLATVAAVVLAACSRGELVQLTATAGGACTACQPCDGLYSCQCTECDDLACDPGTRQMLACCGGVWKVAHECPGGCAVECRSGFAGLEDVRCLDGSGAGVELSALVCPLAAP